MHLLDTVATPRDVRHGAKDHSQQAEVTLLVAFFGMQVQRREIGDL